MKWQQRSGTESAILNRESGDSESCDSNRAIPRMPFGWQFWIEFLWFCFSAIRLSLVLLAAEFLRFLASDSGNRAVRNSRFCAAKVETVFEISLTILAEGKRRQKVAKTIFATCWQSSRATNIPAPFGWFWYFRGDTDSAGGEGR